MVLQRLRELGLFILESWEDLIVAFQQLKGAYKKKRERDFIHGQIGIRQRKQF